MMDFKNEVSFARQLDAKFAKATQRNLFHIPRHNGNDSIYLCGNSLGLQPKAVRGYVEQELKDWAELGVEGHFEAKRPWFDYHRQLTEKEAKVVGALSHEVVVMNNLTTNLHLMLVSFYRPSGKRNKIICEGGAFPSDQYALESQARCHGLDPEETIIELFPRQGEHTLRTEDILQKIKETDAELALVMMGGVNYYTGQAFDMRAITAEAHQAGAKVGFDLAHAAGNLELQLHEDGMDFAVWCSYKYLNSGPGGTSGVFVHERHAEDSQLQRFAGWWGHDEGERFQMKKGFKPMRGAEGWQLSNAQILPMAVHLASLDIFHMVGMPGLRAKSEVLTAYLEWLIEGLNRENTAGITIITPKDPQSRGCQLSLVFSENGRKVFDALSAKGVYADWREPDVIRVAPVPLYNTFEDVWRFAQVVGEVV